MLEKELQELIKDAKKIRQESTENGSASYYDDKFYDLSNFILKNLNNPFLKNKNAKVIANNFDEILPLIVKSNSDILLLKADLLIKQPGFKKKFVEGLKKYPYKDNINQLFYNIWICLDDNSNQFDIFMDNEILETILTMDLSKTFYLNILNNLNAERQGEFLKLLAENKRDIPYSAIEYKENNKQIIYNNISLFIENAQNLYTLMDFVKDRPAAFSQVKDYIDNNEDKAINSIFCEIKIEDSTLREIIKLMILDIMKNENIKFSDITYNGGGFSRVLLIGDKVIKLGDRFTKSFPNNPYIVAPLLRKELKVNDENCFVEVTERVDTSTKPSSEELYKLFKNLRNLGLIWTDIKEENVGRLKRKNIIHWQENLNPSEEVLGFSTKRGETILEEGDLVILDADFIYDENDPNINYSNNKILTDEFEKRYQSEKKELKEQEENSKLMMTEEAKRNDSDINEHKGIRK